ncbi:hypothetical protein HYV57_00865 [Candidatus Peregrinibacteria bacterium]|nr:hypothetical protein [Candidatus Peregrinibacteria bacterium]
MNIVYDIKQESVVPFTLKSNGVFPSVSPHKIALKKNTSYLMSTIVSGTPEIRLDFFGTDYDSAEQELIIPEGTKGSYYFEGLVNSYDVSEGDKYFRAFYTNNNDIIIHDLMLYEVGIKNKLALYLSIILFVFSIIFLSKIVYKKFAQTN